VSSYFETFMPLPYGWRLRLSGYWTSWCEWCISIAIQGPAEPDKYHNWHVTHELSLLGAWTNEGESRRGKRRTTVEKRKMKARRKKA
jgi:hypothetical protein